MAHYLIKIAITVGKYEKYTDILLEADTSEKACTEALKAECHHELDWNSFPAEEPWAVWDGVEFLYRIKSVQLVHLEDLSVLEKYINEYTY